MPVAGWSCLPAFEEMQGNGGGTAGELQGNCRGRPYGDQGGLAGLGLAEPF